MRKCKKCGQSKPVAEFARPGAAKTLSSRCASCRGGAAQSKQPKQAKPAPAAAPAPVVDDVASRVASIQQAKAEAAAKAAEAKLRALNVSRPAPEPVKVSVTVTRINKDSYRIETSGGSTFRARTRKDAAEIAAKFGGEVTWA